MSVSLEVLERGVQMVLNDKMYNRILAEEEYSVPLRARVITIIGRAMGERVDKFEYPLNWQRFVKRKDCPQYMKTIQTININAYYPKLSLPDEENWINIDNTGADDMK